MPPGREILTVWPVTIDRSSHLTCRTLVSAARGRVHRIAAARASVHTCRVKSVTFRILVLLLEVIVPSGTAEDLVFHVRPEFTADVAQQVQADGGRALLQSRGDGIEPIRVP